MVGPSGCGKSTLLEMIAGLARPPKAPSSSRACRSVRACRTGWGWCSRRTPASPGSPWADNITFGLKRQSLPKDEVERRLRQALELMTLQDFARAYPAQLSGGMRQRVCIARTLVMQPRLILLDEPFGALDQQTRLLMGDELLRLWRATGATVLLITHALDEAALLADRVAVMSARPGRILEVIETGWAADRDSRIVSTPPSAPSPAGCGRCCASSPKTRSIRARSRREAGHGLPHPGRGRSPGPDRARLPLGPNRPSDPAAAVADGRRPRRHPQDRPDERRHP